MFCGPEYGLSLHVCTWQLKRCTFCYCWTQCLIMSVRVCWLMLHSSISFWFFVYCWGMVVSIYNYNCGLVCFLFHFHYFLLHVFSALLFGTYTLRIAMSFQETNTFIIIWYDVHHFTGITITTFPFLRLMFAWYPFPFFTINLPISLYLMSFLCTAHS